MCRWAAWVPDIATAAIRKQFLIKSGDKAWNMPRIAAIDATIAVPHRNLFARRTYVGRI
jgi:hypothetical protein